MSPGRGTKAEQVTLQQQAARIVAGKWPFPGRPNLWYQTCAGQRVGPAVSGLLFHHDGAGRNLSDLAGGTELPFKQRSFQGLGQSLGRKEAEDPLMPGEGKPAVQRLVGSGILNEGAILAGNVEGVVDGTMIDNQNFIAWAQTFERAAKMGSIVAGLQDGSDGRHRRRGIRT